METGTSETRLGSSPSRPISLSGLTPGTILADRYRIVALLGRGGMGEVYRADDLRLGQPVALKFLPPGLEDNPFARERLLAEVRSARTVSHPNVCRVYDVGEAHGRVFLTMEYIDGEDLASLLRRIGRLPPSKALEVARQLCAGLAAAHDRGVLHRDLKPANVMIDGRGQARITDFGLAVDVSEGGEGMPYGGARGVVEVAGTIAYMAPERFGGAPATVQSDLYALGLVLYEVYTGKQAVSATTIEGWRRAHSDSTPSHPSAIVSEIEPVVERAILRCLEKDPAKRPTSAALLAGALPGGDPLAAAVAAGETPSPELVAASGGEGVLPRARAWLWFGACLGALALSVLLSSQGRVVNLLPLKDPATQRGTARQILWNLGYRQAPADCMTKYVRNSAVLRMNVENRSPRDWFGDLGTPGLPPVVFAYRESPEPLFSWDPFPAVDVENPGPLYPDDVSLELDGDGRLNWLTAGGVGSRSSEPAGASPTNWSGLFAAAGLDQSGFKEVPSAWAPVFTADESRAWEGRVGRRQLRVEASAYRGRPVQFVVAPVQLRPPGRPATKTALRRMLDFLIAASIYSALVVLAILARHNLRHGRGDKKGSFRLALAVLVLETLYFVLNRHWTFEPLAIVQVLVFLLGAPLFATAFTWLAYVGVEPFMRRRWPDLLIAWTRLLDGRWRDPMVGRSLLSGTLVALVGVGVIPGILIVLTRAYSLPLAAPWFTSGTLDGGVWFLASKNGGWVAPVHTFVLVAWLVAARLALRRNWAAWAAVACVTFGAHWWDVLVAEPWWSAVPWAPVLVAALCAAGFVLATARWGLLAGVTFYAVWEAVFKTPLTLDPTRWYAWRTGVLVLLVGGLAFWGFRNVLGRQSAFPAGALDE